MRPGSPSHDGGFTYLGLVATVAVTGLGLAVVGPRWADDVQREREAELLRVGGLYARALADYRRASPGNVKAYPRSLDDLLIDTRFIGGERHLRRLYPDPMQPNRPWGLVRDGNGGIVGVYSHDERAPFRQTSIETPTVNLSAAVRYSDWKFVAKVQP